MSLPSLPITDLWAQDVLQSLTLFLRESPHISRLNILLQHPSERISLQHTSILFLNCPAYFGTVMALLYSWSCDPSVHSSVCIPLSSTVAC